MNIAERKAALMRRVRDYGGELNELPVLAQFLAQVMHESGGLRYVREIWGPTAAQKRYEGRADLGNTQPGDGKRFMGRDVLQITGRANHRALTQWVRKTFGVDVDFEKNPELLESPEWLGIGAIWYFLTRKGLMLRCREGNIEMATRLVNGGLNGYQDRLHWYDKIALELLGYDNVRQFQQDQRLVTDGVSGPKTRAAMHAMLTKRQAAKPSPTVTLEPASPPTSPAQRAEPVPAPAPAPKVNGPVALVVLAVLSTIAAAATGAWNWLLSWF